MEYISKQSLLADLNEATPRSYFAFETMVREYPTEDVAPVTHAHWKEYVDVGGAIYIECSACGLIWWLDEGTAEENEMFYCPRCGAKMDEEVEADE